jgi:hypothetical protein
MNTAQHMAWLNAIRHEIHMRHQFHSEPCPANFKAWQCAKNTLKERTPAT